MLPPPIDHSKPLLVAACLNPVDCYLSVDALNTYFALLSVFIKVSALAALPLPLPALESAWLVHGPGRHVDCLLAHFDHEPVFTLLADLPLEDRAREGLHHDALELAVDLEGALAVDHDLVSGLYVSDEQAVTLPRDRLTLVASLQLSRGTEVDIVEFVWCQNDSVLDGEILKH